MLDAPNEIYNMKFVKDILADDVSIKHEDGIYKVRFSVDPNADRELLEQWFEKPKKDVAEGGQPLNAYLRYVCDLEVWDNGYAKSYSADYVRDAKMASGVTVDSFSYLWNENEILKIISDDFRLDDVSEHDKNKLNEIDDYIEYYTQLGTVKPSLSPLYIALIVIGCVVFVAIVAAITVEILVRKGKLPKLAARREAKKQKRAAKKAMKKDYAKAPYSLTSEGQGADDLADVDASQSEQMPKQESDSPQGDLTDGEEASPSDGEE